MYIQPVLLQDKFFVSLLSCLDFCIFVLFVWGFLTLFNICKVLWNLHRKVPGKGLIPVSIIESSYFYCLVWKALQWQQHTVENAEVKPFYFPLEMYNLSWKKFRYSHIFLSRKMKLLTFLFFFKACSFLKSFHLYSKKSILKLNIVNMLVLGLICFFINGSLADRQRNKYALASIPFPAALQPFSVIQSAMLCQYLITGSVELLKLSGKEYDKRIYKNTRDNNT